MRISDWSSDVCSSDLLAQACVGGGQRGAVAQGFADQGVELGVAERGPPVAGRERGVAERRNIQAAAAGERIGFDRVFPWRQSTGARAAGQEQRGGKRGEHESQPASRAGAWHESGRGGGRERGWPYVGIWGG